MVAVKTIGYVETEASHEELRRDRWKILSRIVLYEAYADGLRGLDEYSHVMVVYWMHELAGSKKIQLIVRPRGRPDLPEVGIFATRNPSRPNPIAVTVVELVQILKNTLVVRGLDALNRSPVLDIKPYDYYDVFPDIKVPHWFKKIWVERVERRN